MSHITYTNLQVNGSFAIKVDGVQVGELWSTADGQWKVRLTGSRREATRSSLPSAKSWVSKQFD